MSENEIIQSLGETCKKGYYIEPTSASAVAGIKKYLDMIKDKDEVVVSVFTGHGLKSTDKISHLLDR